MLEQKPNATSSQVTRCKSVDKQPEGRALAVNGR
jgi:hypothetical protein